MLQETRDRLLVHWQGRQWAVTSYGIETITAPITVRIPKRRLGGVAHDMSGYTVVPEILAQQWLDVSDFWEAWEQARIWHNECFADIPLIWRNALARRTQEAIRKRLADAALSNMAKAAAPRYSQIRPSTYKRALRRIDP
jgi:hypothetical protein